MKFSNLVHMIINGDDGASTKLMVWAVTHYYHDTDYTGKKGVLRAKFENWTSQARDEMPKLLVQLTFPLRSTKNIKNVV